MDPYRDIIERILSGKIATRDELTDAKYSVSG
jgi:hypothetical protein